MESFTHNGTQWLIDIDWQAKLLEGQKASKLLRKLKTTARKAAQTGFFALELPSPDPGDAGISYFTTERPLQGDLPHIGVAAFAKHCASSGFAIGKFVVPNVGFWIVAAQDGLPIMHPVGDRVFKGEDEAYRHLKALMDHAQVLEKKPILFANREALSPEGSRDGYQEVSLSDFLTAEDGFALTDLSKKGRSPKAAVVLAGLLALILFYQDFFFSEEETTKDDVKPPKIPGNELAADSGAAARACYQAYLKLPLVLPGWDHLKTNCSFEGDGSRLAASSEFKRAEVGSFRHIDDLRQMMMKKGIRLTVNFAKETVRFYTVQDLRPRGVENLLDQDTAFILFRDTLQPLSEKLDVKPPLPGSGKSPAFEIRSHLSPIQLSTGFQRGTVVRSLSFTHKDGWRITGELYVSEG